MSRIVTAVTRALSILEVFEGEPGGLSAAEIREKTGLPRSTIHDLVGTLLACGYLERVDRDGRKVRLGVPLFRLGNVYQEQLDTLAEARLAADALAEKVGETLNVGHLDGTWVVYLVSVEGSGPVRVVSPVGKRKPAHATAMGKALLSELPDGAIDALYGGVRQLEAVTAHTLTSIGALKEQLKAVRMRGYAVERGEVNEAVACVAAVVRDRTEAAVYAMSIAVPIARWSPEREDELGQVIREGAARLSHRLGSLSLADETYTAFRGEGHDLSATERIEIAE